MSGPPKTTPPAAIPPPAHDPASRLHAGLTAFEWYERACSAQQESEKQSGRADSYKLECAALREDLRRRDVQQETPHIRVERVLLSEEFRENIRRNIAIGRAGGTEAAAIEQHQNEPPGRALRLPLREATVLRGELHRAHDELFEAGKIIAGRDLPRTGKLFEGAAARIARILAANWCAVCQKPLDMSVESWRQCDGGDLVHASCVTAGPPGSATGTQGNVAGPAGVEGESGGSDAFRPPPGCRIW